jgi:hypothetical protein
MSHARTILAGFWLVSFCVCSAQLMIGQAPTTPTTAHGTITLQYQSEGALFTLTTVYPGNQPGSGWSAAGAFDDSNGWPTLCNPCVSSITVFGESTNGDFLGGTANTTTVAANTYFPSVNWGNFLSPGGSGFLITGPSIAIPPPGNVPGLYVGTFSLTGSLCGFVVPFFNECTPNLTMLENAPGTGVVFVTLAVNHIGQLYATQVVFTF